MKLKKTLVLASTILAALALSQSAVAGCFTVYNSKGQLVKRGASSPVDMQYHLHQTVPARYGKGASMVFASTGESCGDYSRPVAQKKTRKGKKAAKGVGVDTAIPNPDDVLENLAASYRRDIPGFGSVMK